MIKNYLTVKQAAEKLNLSTEYVRRLVKNGRIPADKSLGIVAIKMSDIEEFEDEQKR